MNEQEYFNSIALAERRRDALVSTINSVYSEENRKADIGDIVVSSTNRIRVDSIRVMPPGLFEKLPTEKYIGQKLTKKNEVAKNQKDKAIYSTNIVEIIKQNGTVLKKCNVCKELKDNVSKDNCPFDADVNQKNVKDIMCDECFQKLSDDV